MELLTLLKFAVLSSLMILPVKPQGFKCPNANYRLFAVHTSISNLWSGNNVDAASMCAKAGHILANNINCLRQLAPDQVFGPGPIPKAVWVGQSLKPENVTDCISWSHESNKTVVSKCTESQAALCQGLSSVDHQLSESFKSGNFPYTQIFGATTSSSESLPGVDLYYVLCGILGVILISIVIAAAIWRSGYINNRYSFRRLPPAAAANQRQTAPKSRTVTSQLDSEVPHGYVKASVTKETIA